MIILYVHAYLHVHACVLCTCTYIQTVLYINFMSSSLTPVVHVYMYMYMLWSTNSNFVFRISYRPILGICFIIINYCVQMTLVYFFPALSLSLSSLSSQYFMRHSSSVSLKVVLQDAHRMFEATPTDIHPKGLLEGFVPLTKETYPVFNKYPTFVVDYHVCTVL